MTEEVMILDWQGILLGVTEAIGWMSLEKLQLVNKGLKFDCDALLISWGGGGLPVC